MAILSSLTDLELISLAHLQSNLMELEKVLLQRFEATLEVYTEINDKLEEQADEEEIAAYELEQESNKGNVQNEQSKIIEFSKYGKHKIDIDSD